jgi:hypothetical protein
MLDATFPTIEKFIKLREKCVFCHRPLKVTLINHFANTSEIPRLISNFDGSSDILTFQLDHATDSFHLKCEGILDITSNTLKFNSMNPMYGININLANTVFEGLMPHFELYCSSKECNMSYCMASSVLQSEYTATDEVLKIRPIYLNSENYSFDDLWIDNDWHRKQTYIFSKKQHVTKSIKTAIISCDSMNKETLINKIKTVVNFS